MEMLRHYYRDATSASDDRVALHKPPRSRCAPKRENSRPRSELGLVANDRRPPTQFQPVSLASNPNCCQRALEYRHEGRNEKQPF
jgi:hypothetical protein